MSAGAPESSPLPPPPPVRALVVGATGYVGRAVVAELRRKKLEVQAHVRFDSPRLEEMRALFQKLGAECVTTAWNRDDFKELAHQRGLTHVFLCLGTTFRRGKRKSTSSVPETYAAVDVGLSTLVIEACVQSGLRPRVVLLSAARANPAARNPYLAARGKVEALLQASGLDFTIAQPGFITGSDREEFRPLERIGAWMTDWFLLWGAVLGMQIMRERYRSIDARELAKALVTHALDPLSANRVLMGERLRDFP
ncbi:MAG TPA: NAD(P)H-binding protein [Planctomycetota bacterium]|nr:NAD(P)H-binding protein [Planctomycetota bacterium]